MTNLARHLCTLMLALFISAAYAAEISVLPVGLSLSAQQSKGMITVSNLGKENIVVHAETLSWGKLDEKNYYTTTNQLLVNPSVFTIPAGQSQVLRVGLRNTQSSDKENAYRLILREVPTFDPALADSSDNKPGNIKVLLRISMPVYVTPNKTIVSHKWKMQKMPDGSLKVRLSNQGSVHTLVNEFSVMDASVRKQSTVIATVKANEVVFPGQEYTWTVTPQGKLHEKNYVVEVKTDKGQQNVAVDLEPMSEN